MDIKTNKGKTFAQKYPELNQNETRKADYTNKIQYNERVYNQQGGIKSERMEINTPWYIGNMPLPYNQNYLGVKTSHFVPQQGPYTWDLSYRNNSTPKVPDSQLLFVKSHVPRAFS